MPPRAGSNGWRSCEPAPFLSTFPARWDLSSVELVDARCAQRLCTLYPLDKRANAQELRRRTSPGDNDGAGNADGG